MSILAIELGTKIWAILRFVIWWIDSIGFAFIDNTYDLMVTIMAGFNSDAIADITKGIIENCYILVGIFAFFRIAVMLVESIVNPEKLSDKNVGLSKVFVNFVIAIVMLIVVPIIFSFSRDIQNKLVVENQVIPNLILGTDLNTGKAGETMQLIAIKSLIKPSDKLATEKDGKYNINGNCGDGTTCFNAVQAWNDNRVRTVTVSKFIDQYVKVGEEYVFVYDYIPFVPLAAGLFITYVLLSFTIDIGIRSVELVVLEIVSPFFIVTFIDPKMAASGPFKKWLNACVKSYLSLFIRIAIISVIFLFLSNFYELAGSFNGNALANIVLLLCILIFAKKAPKWIGEMFGLSDGAGVGGLGIGKKLGGAALVGGALEKGLGKASGALAGGAAGAAAMLHANNKNRRALKKEARDKLGYKRGIGKKARQARQSLYDANKNDKKYADMSKRQALNAMKKDAYAGKNVGGLNDLKQVGSSIGIGLRDGGKVGLSTGKVSGSFTGASKAVSATAAGMGLKEGKLHALASKVRKLPSMEDAWGTATERYEAVQTAAKNEKVANWTNGKCSAGSEKGQLVAGQGAANKFISSTKIGDGENAIPIATYDDFLAAQFATGSGYDLKKMSKTVEMVKDKDGNDQKKITYSYVDSKGETKTISAESLQKDLGGLVNPASSYSVESQKMFNNYQTECLNNYNSNQQLASQVQSNYQGAVMQANTCATNAKQMTDAITAGLTAALGGVSIKIDTNSMAGLRDGVEKNLDVLNKKMETADDSKKKELEKYINALTEIKEQCEQKEIFDEQIEEYKNAFNDIKESNEKLSVIVKEIDGKTTTEKQQNLVSQKGKIEDSLKAFEKKKEDK